MLCVVCVVRLCADADVIEAPIGILDNFVFGISCAGNNWAKGHYTEDAELIDEVVDEIRKESAGCDCSQGFQIIHPLRDRKDSGLGTLLLMKIRDNYPEKITAMCSVYPSSKVSNVVVQPYTATLSIHQLLKNNDKREVCNILHNILKQQHLKYVKTNWVISLEMTGISASAILRFSGNLNGDFKKTDPNLVPFPRLHFFGIAPLFAPAKFKPEDDKYVSTQEVDERVKIQPKMSND